MLPRHARLKLLAVLLGFGMLLGTGGCFPPGFGSDLVASVVSAVVGNTLSAFLDATLPQR